MGPSRAAHWTGSVATRRSHALGTFRPPSRHKAAAGPTAIICAQHAAGFTLSGPAGGRDDQERAAGLSLVASDIPWSGAPGPESVAPVKPFLWRWRVGAVHWT